jgi:tetratricopeptide (TPR) repeat protein
VRALLNPVERQFCDAIATDPTGDAYDYAARHYTLFTQYRTRRMGPEALSELTRARQYWPPVAFVETDMAQLMVAMHRLDEAERYLARAKRLDPGYAPVHFVSGALLHMRGDRTQAAKEFRTYLEAEPSGPYANASRQALAALGQSIR